MRLRFSAWGHPRGWEHPGDALGTLQGCSWKSLGDTLGMLQGCSRVGTWHIPPSAQHSPISLSCWPRARVPARKQTLARRQTAPVPLRWQFFWMTLMAGGSTVSDVLIWTIWRELAAR